MISQLLFLIYVHVFFYKMLAFIGKSDEVEFEFWWMWLC